jgi:hypothetical protein
VLVKINEWIDDTLRCYHQDRVPCSRFAAAFQGFYSPEFLSNSFYVLTNDVPRPDFPELREAGLSEIIDMESNGITYKNTYFVKCGLKHDLKLHFHELLHVAQWQPLGALDFIHRYIAEINQHTYDGAPLERMAYELDSLFQEK